MALVEGKCDCTHIDCSCDNHDKLGWVDAVTGSCRDCEITHGKRWGHNTAKAEESAGQLPGEHVI